GPIIVFTKRRTPVCMPEMFLRLILIMAQSIERFVGLRLVQICCRRCNAIYRINFRSQIPLLIRNDPKFLLYLRNTDGLSNPFEQVHYRCTTELKRSRTHMLFKRNEAVRFGFPYRNHKLERCAQICFVDTTDAGQIEEKELLRKIEILLQQ